MGLLPDHSPGVAGGAALTPDTPSSPAILARFFDGLDLVPPGLVQCQRWRPDPGATNLEENVSCWGAVARKP